jgi:hypothetical protein
MTLTRVDSPGPRNVLASVIYAARGLQSPARPVHFVERFHRRSRFGRALPQRSCAPHPMAPALSLFVSPPAVGALHPRARYGGLHPSALDACCGSALHGTPALRRTRACPATALAGVHASRRNGGAGRDDSSATSRRSQRLHIAFPQVGGPSP